MTDVPLATYHVGPKDATSKQYKCLLVVVDGFTKFTRIYPTKSTNATEVVDRMKIQQAVFGKPGRIVTDRGEAFTSADLKNYCDEVKITLTHITTGVPRDNG